MRHLVITGLRLKSPLYQPLFMYHAMRSMTQAQCDPDCLHAEARTIDGVAHTITLWKDVKAARHYGMSGAHRAAAAVFSKIASGKVYSGASLTVPSWAEARRLWDEEGILAA